MPETILSSPSVSLDMFSDWEYGFMLFMLLRYFLILIQSIPIRFTFC